MAFAGFQLDENFVGVRPQRETSWENLNDNVSESFLRSLAEKDGAVVLSVKIFTHPSTRRHLGIGASPPPPTLRPAHPPSAL